MKPVSENSPLPSLSQRASAVPSTAALPALWRETSTKPVKVTRTKPGQAERSAARPCPQIRRPFCLSPRLKVGPQQLACEAVQSALKSSLCIDTVLDSWEGSSMIVSLFQGPGSTGTAISLVTDVWY